MSELLQSLAEGFDGDASQRELLDATLADGLPGPRSEAWKYTSLRALERRRFAAVERVPHVDPLALAHIPAPRAVFINGRFSAAHSLLKDLADGISLRLLSESLASGEDDAAKAQTAFERDDVFARLNAALSSEGLLLHVEPGVYASRPLHLVFVSAQDGEETRDLAWHLRNRIDIGAGAGLVLVEHQLALGEHAHLGNSTTRITIADGARLAHARSQRDSARATQLLRTDAVLGNDSQYIRIDVELGAALSRHQLNVRLQGDNARLLANGVLLADGRRHIDTRLGIDHVGRDTCCELTWRGIGAERGRVVFRGGILIREGADGTDAALSNKNLLLSEHAEVDTQPVLEIHADEVKAAHGATVGQLDANALFYLRSRGLGEQQAKQLLTSAFCREPVAMTGEAAIIEWLDAQLDVALAGLERA
ncbi:Fe-S cluster assembly protein SufD [Pseudoxanthomonas dokdonensis]|uniref:ABC transporter permease n=1 Tax=Pseudoxanthomonas dokdonensis TaxID=344882 RepID=A0A0R0CNP7_9GAMM|nr:Fe-S cluster assembly protein SufD [Pseudoxanthomonas dokdonensis]KRG68002.1 ABC transporter permease [Pseudoxanthomonas dokdonensis]